MNMRNRHHQFVVRYLTRGAIGVSVGLATVAASPASARQETNWAEQTLTKSFSERLSTVWSAITDSATAPLQLAQITRPPYPHEKIFTNQFDKARPFHDVPHGKIFTNQFNKLP